MISLQFYLALLVAPLFLLHALSLQAQSASPLAHRIEPCNSLKEKTPGVERRLNQYRELVRGRKCLVLSANRKENLDKLIRQAPENTVVLLTSNSEPVRGRNPVEYFIYNQIVLKDGQSIIGAADDGFEIIIMFRGYGNHHMVKVGTTKNFRFGEKRDNHIRHLTFRPIGYTAGGPDASHPMPNSIIFAECYNRTLFVEDNIFHLPKWSAINLDCKEPLDATADLNRPGPGLQFANNTVRGYLIKTAYLNYMPEDGVFVNLPAIRNQSQRITVTDNTFLGRMAEAGEFTLGSGTHLDIFRNTVDITNDGLTNTLRDARAQRPPRVGGFTLIGHTDANAEPPLFNLAGNRIRVTAPAINVSPPLKLALACNHLQATSPWQQLQQDFSLQAADPLPLGGECEKPTTPSINMPTPNSTVAMPLASSTVFVPTPVSYSISQILNTWTAINSSATACDGLTNFEGRFFFESGVCPTVARSSAFTTDTAFRSNTMSDKGLTSTSSTDSNRMTSGLGVITILAILLAL
ncbi:hypothetical protein [Endozoicomonas sp. 8E]|uniref:hypothetical protein n=1 Tax=Endozoicomonas sp. 8E TaxID=3035692 RepID=UPI00293944A2|nr:hypothetical protein [Endozoicomonas sp. 8E]WOG27748.1 hypothetical protein P6910_24905 [Endozoicomonas sp. 8E]